MKNAIKIDPVGLQKARKIQSTKYNQIVMGSSFYYFSFQYSLSSEWLNVHTDNGPVFRICSI